MKSALSRDRRLDVIFTAHFDAVRACCVRRLPSDEANDAVAEVSLVVWPRIDAVPFDDHLQP